MVNIVANVKEGAAKNKKVIMVAIDEGEYSHYALVWVLENLKESLITKSARLVIFMAQPPPHIPNIYSVSPSLGFARMFFHVSPTPELVKDFQEKRKLFTLALLKKAKDICGTQGVSAETMTEVGESRAAICNAVQKHNVNLLVLGQPSIGKLKRAIFGSVSDHCMQNAKCPVLVVKKPQ